MRIATLCCMLFVITSSAFAAPIKFIHTGIGSGSIGGTAFTEAAFTITSLGDTDNRSSGAAGVFALVHDTSSIDIDGVGTFALTSDTRTFVSNTLELVGYAQAVADFGDLIDGPNDAALSSWDMLSPIGPLAGTGEILQWGGPVVDDIPFVVTDGGNLVFADAASVNVTFQAIIVPEPVTCSLLLVGMTAMGILRRRKA